MSSTEAYLDGLLKAALESEEKNAKDALNNSEEIENEEDILENFADRNMNNGVLEMVDKETKEELSHSLGEDEIAALFAEAGIAQENMDLGTLEETVHENVSEDLSGEQGEMSVLPEFPLTDEVLVKENIGEIQVDAVDNEVEGDVTEAGGVLGADEIAALFAEAGIEEEPVVSQPEEKNVRSEEATTMADDGFIEELTKEVETEMDDSEIADLLEIMSENNDELAEINDLLKKSDSNELTDLEEETDQEQIQKIEAKKVAKKEKKKKKSLFGRKNKSKDGVVELPNDEEKQQAIDTSEEVQFADSEENKEQDNFVDLLSQLGDGDFTAFDELSGVDNSFEQQLDGVHDNSSIEFIGIDGDIPDIPDKKKKGLAATFFDWLTEEVEEEELEEIKDKTKKTKKNKKEKRAEKKAKTENEELIDELDAEDAKGKKGKKKKAKKIKIPKKKLEDIQEPEGKKLPIKRVIPVFVLCGSILLLIILISNGLIVFTSLKSARAAYYNRDYETTYQNLVGKKLNENDQLILEKTTLIMSVQRKYDSYLNYVNLGNDVYACNALISGYKLYLDSYALAVDYRITDELDSLKRLIVDALWNSYGISEEKAVELNNIQDANEYKESLNFILQEVNSQAPDQSRDTENVNMVSDDLSEILAEEQGMMDQDIE